MERRQPDHPLPLTTVSLKKVYKRRREEEERERERERMCVESVCVIGTDEELADKEGSGVRPRSSGSSGDSRRRPLKKSSK